MNRAFVIAKSKLMQRIQDKNTSMLYLQLKNRINQITWQ